MCVCLRRPERGVRSLGAGAVCCLAWCWKRGLGPLQESCALSATERLQPQVASILKSLTEAVYVQFTHLNLQIYSPSAFSVFGFMEQAKKTKTKTMLGPFHWPPPYLPPSSPSSLVTSSPPPVPRWFVFFLTLRMFSRFPTLETS